MDYLDAALHDKFGFERFRGGQRDVIERVLARKHTLAVLPTGLGKSLCYQLPAQIMTGITLVISPLIALMRDQVDSLRQHGFGNVTFLNSSLEQAAIAARYSDIERGKYKLIYVAPERCDSPRFQQLVTKAQIDLLVIDEAHCISQWGHDFRPHYRSLLKRLPELDKATLLAMTATATPEVRKDIEAALGRPMQHVVADFNRPNLFFEVIQVEDRDLKNETLLEMLSSDSGRAIVYASTRKDAESTRRFLESHGVSACLYHAGLTPADRAEGHRLFQAGEGRVMVATVAFGMGIDKPDIRRVIHYNIPGSLESYYQEAGRAGRDGLPATCTLLFSSQDLRVQRFLLESSYPDHSLVYAVYDALRDAHPLPVAPADVATRTQLPELAVKAALQAMYEQEYLGLARDGKYFVNKPELRRPPINFSPLAARGRRAERRLENMVAYASGRTCRRAAILKYFGQDYRAPCGACDACTPRAEHTVETPSQRSDDAAREILRAVKEFTGRLGRTMVSEVLSGSRRKKLIESGMDSSPSYAALRRYGKELTMDCIDELIKRGLLGTTTGNYPTLYVTDRGKQAMNRTDMISLTRLGSGRSPQREAPSSTTRSLAAMPSRMPNAAASSSQQPQSPEENQLRLDVEMWRQGGPEPDCQALLAALDDPLIPQGDAIVFITVLGELAYKPAKSKLYKMLVEDAASHGDANFVHALSTAVARLGAVDAAPVFIELLDDPRAMVRSAAARALGRLRTKAALVKLQRIAADEKSVSVRLAARAAAALIASDKGQ
jgi:ATP-dependent DNA helicase RecQ